VRILHASFSHASTSQRYFHTQAPVYEFSMHHLQTSHCFNLCSSLSSSDFMRAFTFTRDEEGSLWNIHVSGLIRESAPWDHSSCFGWVCLFAFSAKNTPSTCATLATLDHLTYSSTTRYTSLLPSSLPFQGLAAPSSPSPLKAPWIYSID
jgi:hypothetical protein